MNWNLKQSSTGVDKYSKGARSNIKYYDVRSYKSERKHAVC